MRHGWLLALALIAAVPAAAHEPEPARLLLVRHGFALSNVQPRPAGLTDAQLDHLTDEGRAQARAAGRALASARPALVVSSPAMRAQETAREIAAGLGGLEVRVDPRLRPMEMGTDESGAELAWSARQAEFRAGRDPRPTGGESLADVVARVSALGAELAARHGGRAVVLVAHSEVIGPFAATAGGKSQPQDLLPKVANGSVTTVEVGLDGSRKLVALGVTPEP
jgi:probable phosphoglycerate mutase